MLNDVTVALLQNDPDAVISAVIRICPDRVTALNYAVFNVSIIAYIYVVQNDRVSDAAVAAYEDLLENN